MQDVASPTTHLGSDDTVAVARPLPVAPPAAPPALQIVVTSTPGGDDGVEVALAALAQRPDVRAVAVPTAAGLVPAPLVDADLVVVGIDLAHGPTDGAGSDLARAIAAAGGTALELLVEANDAADHGAAALQLLDLLDRELASLTEDGPSAWRLTVPSCREGMLRGRVVVDEAIGPTRPSDCTAADPGPDADERSAFAAGWATLLRLA